MDGSDCKDVKCHGIKDIFRTGTNVTKYFMIGRKQATEYERDVGEWKNNEFQRALVNKEFRMNSTTCSI